MLNTNESYKKIIKCIITVSLYFIWPFLIKLLINLLNIKENILLLFICNLVLLCIILLIYSRNLFNSLNKLSLKKIFYLFVALLIVQLLTNLISVFILGINNYKISCGILPQSLEKWPVLFAINLVCVYPILESFVFSKSLRDVINDKWAFIICSALFFWIVNLSSFDFNIASLFATISCFTSSIVFNYFYYKEDNISLIIIVKMIYNLIFLLLP